MALNPTTLADALKALPVDAEDEQSVKDGLATAWAAYWEESVANAVPANPAPAVAITAFKAALTGISTPGNTPLQAATLLVGACKAFWAAALPLLAYPTVPPPAGPWALVPSFMLTPASEALFAAALAAVFLANMTTSAAKDDAMAAIATAIHAAPQAGATFLDTTPPVPVLYVVA